MAQVDISALGKSYGAVSVLKEINLHIEDGEFVVLVGPSGCGKSTLLRTIAGLEAITSGDIRIGDEVVNTMSPQSRDIAMVFQNYALYPQMSVRENMSFGLRLRHQPKDRIAREVERAAEILGLTALLDRYPRQLSGGQRQRVAIGRAIVRHPRVFLFDEPLSNLDAKLRVQMRREIKELHQKLATTFIYVTHDQIEAMTMADRIVVLNGGHIEQVGTPLELYDAPANLFVAGFIGSPSINQLSGTVASFDGGTMIDVGAGVSMPLPALDGIEVGQEVVVGLRPEHLFVEADPDGKGVVQVVEPTGSETHVFFEWLGCECCAVHTGRTPVLPGNRIKVGFEADSALVFDATSKRRIFPAPADCSG